MTHEQARQLKPGDEIIIDHEAVGGTSHGERHCLVVSTNWLQTNGTVHVRPERCPTKAEQARGDYDRWTKSPRPVRIEHIIRRAEA